MSTVLHVAYLLLVAGGSAFAQSETRKFPDLKSFHNELLQESKALSAGTDSVPANVVPLSWQVNTAEGEYTVSSAPIRELLQQKNVRAARGWLQELARQIGQDAEPPADPTAAAASLHSILSGHEFAKRAPPSDFARFRRKLGEWVRDWLKRLLVNHFPRPSAWRSIFWTAVALAAGFLAVLAYQLWIRPATYQKSGTENTSEHAERPWQEWLASAGLAAANNNFRRAVHCAYWAGVARLQDAGDLPGNSTLTPREYLRLLSTDRGTDRLANAREPLRSLTSSLERFWYGRSTPTDSDFHACLKSLEALGCQLP